MMYIYLLYIIIIIHIIYIYIIYDVCNNVFYNLILVHIGFSIAIRGY